MTFEIFAVDVEVEDSCKEAAFADDLDEIGEVERDRLRRRVVAVDDAWNFAFTTHCPSGPLAGFGSRRGFDFGSHSHDVETPMEKGPGEGPRVVHNRRAGPPRVPLRDLRSA